MQVHTDNKISVKHPNIVYAIVEWSVYYVHNLQLIFFRFQISAG